MKTSQDVAAFYNSRFWPVPKMSNSKSAQLKVTFEDENGSVEMNIEVYAETTIHEMFRTYAQYLKENPFVEDKVVDFGIVTHRDNDYLVEIRASGKAYIKNQATAKEISDETPTGKKIISIFKERDTSDAL